MNKNSRTRVTGGVRGLCLTPHPPEIGLPSGDGGVRLSQTPGESISEAEGSRFYEAQFADEAYLSIRRHLPCCIDPLCPSVFPSVAFPFCPFACRLPCALNRLRLFFALALVFRLPFFSTWFPLFFRPAVSSGVLLLHPPFLNRIHRKGGLDVHHVLICAFPGFIWYRESWCFTAASLFSQSHPPNRWTGWPSCTHFYYPRFNSVQCSLLFTLTCQVF